MTINDAITRNDLAQIATIKDSFPYNTFGITKVALERIVLHGITFCGVAKLISTCVVWITGSLAFPVIEVALLLGACFIAIKVAKSLIDYDRLDNADSIPYFKQVRDDFELKFIAYEKLLELDVDVKDKVRTMLDDFVRCHSLSRIFKYGLLPENYNKIFALVRKEMTFNQAFEFYRAFEKAKNAHPEGVNYTLAHPRMWRDQLIDEIYDAKKGELRMPLDELLEEYDFTLLFNSGVFDGEPSEYNELYLALSAAKQERQKIDSRYISYNNYMKERKSYKDELQQKLDGIEARRRYNPFIQALSRNIDDFAKEIKKYRCEKDQIVDQAETKYAEIEKRLNGQQSTLGACEQNAILAQKKCAEDNRTAAVSSAENDLLVKESDICRAFKARYSNTLRELRKGSVEDERIDAYADYRKKVDQLNISYSGTILEGDLNRLRTGTNKKKILHTLALIRPA